MQLGVSFVAWVGFAISLWRGYYRHGRPRGTRSMRVLRAAAMLILGVGLLFAGLLWLQRNQGIVDGQLTALGWISSTLLGAIFVAMQVDAADALISIVFENETPAASPASDAQEGKKET